MSVAEFPVGEDLSGATPVIHEDVAARHMEVFIDETASAQQVAELGAEIAHMPEVELYTYVSKKQALEEFRERLGKDADQILDNLPVNPLPASFRILVRDPRDADAVAERFFYDRRVDNDPGTTNGVKLSDPDRASKMLLLMLWVDFFDLGIPPGGPSPSP